MALTTDGLAHEYVGKLNAHTSYSSTATTWHDLVGNADITLVDFDMDYPTTSGWHGDGSAGDPYRIHSAGVAATAESYMQIAGGNWQDSPFSVEMWVYPEESVTGYNQVFLWHRDASPDSGFWLYLGTSGDYFKYSVRATTSYYDFKSSHPAADGMRHIVLTFGSDSWQAYYNGGVSGSAQSHTYTVNTDTTIWLGRNDTGGYGMHGDWATIRWYSKALSADEVAANYAAGVLAASTDSSATFMPHIMRHHFIPQQLGGH